MPTANLAIGAPPPRSVSCIFLRLIRPANNVGPFGDNTIKTMTDPAPPSEAMSVLPTENEALVAAVDNSGLQGGRLVDAEGVNVGALRCPRCTARLVTKKALLVEKEETLAVPASAETWDESQHSWWWRLVDHTDFDQCAMSHYHETPHGKVRYAMCPECMFGPIGFQKESEPEVLIICDKVKQQDLEFCDNAVDFKAPEGFDPR